MLDLKRSRYEQKIKIKFEQLYGRMGAQNRSLSPIQSANDQTQLEMQCLSATQAALGATLLSANRSSGVS